MWGSIARLIRALEIDIAVDLMGYTDSARPRIYGFRPAPVQALYLGYPSTMGGDSIDYVLGDETVIQEQDRPYFTEQALTRAGQPPPGAAGNTCRAEAVRQRPRPLIAKPAERWTGISLLWWQKRMCEAGRVTRPLAGACRPRRWVSRRCSGENAGAAVAAAHAVDGDATSAAGPPPAIAPPRLAPSYSYSSSPPRVARRS